MMLNISIKYQRVVIIMLLILILLFSFSQKREKWVITKVISTFLQVGVAKPVNINLKDDEKFYLGKNIYIQDSPLFFSKELKGSDSYADTVLCSSANA
jgi:dimeric dUTPase (all-alpha-NTP-PPase superfamily)